MLMPCKDQCKNKTQQLIASSRTAIRRGSLCLLPPVRLLGWLLLLLLLLAWRAYHSAPLHPLAAAAQPSSPRQGPAG